MVRIAGLKAVSFGHKTCVSSRADLLSGLKPNKAARMCGWRRSLVRASLKAGMLAEVGL